MDYDALLSLIKRRRSIRKYEPEPVPLETVMKVLETARWAPSGDNSQPWEFVVVRDKEKLDQVMDILIESARQCREACPRFTFVQPERFNEASTLIIVRADPRFKSAYPRSLEGHPLEEMFRENSEKILIESVTYAMSFVCLAAVSLGLGTLFFTSPGEGITGEQLKEALDIPDVLQPICCIPLGYPSQDRQTSISPTTRVPRPLETMVHIDGFDKAKWRTNKEVAEHLSVGRKTWARFYRTGRMT